MFLNKYGVARHIYVPIVKRGVVDFAVGADWTPAAGDVKISKDGGAFANVSNLPTVIASANTGAVWDFSLTATEMQAKQIVVVVSDAATKAIEDQTFILETYGDPSALHPFDLATATQNVNVSTIAAATGLVVRTGTAQAGAASTITLDAGASATDNFYVGQAVVITGSTGAGQVRVITSYVGSTKVATVAGAWATNPSGTSTFALLPARSLVDALSAGVVNAAAINADTGLIVRSGTAQAGAASTITLDAGASATDNLYVGQAVVVTGGAGAGQVRVITGYVGSTKIATVSAAWATNPAGASTFALVPARVLMDAIASGAITSAAYSAGAIDANAIATDAFGALELAAGAGTEIAAAVWAQAMSDLAAVPAANASALAALNWVFEQMRNKITQSSTTITVFKDDGATTLAQAGVSDDGVTVTRGEFA